MYCGLDNQMIIERNRIQTKMLFLDYVQVKVNGLGNIKDKSSNDCQG